MDLPGIIDEDRYIAANWPSAAWQRVFVGREAELATLDGALEDVRARGPRIVLIDGPSGMGKTALIQEFERTARAPTVLRASGEEAETGLAFGVIGQFVAQANVPPADGLSAIDDGARTHMDPLIVGRAFLDLLGRVQTRSPVLLLLDDVQWADSPSLHALTFAFRRLRVDQVLVIASTRDIADPRLPGGLRRLTASSAGLRMPLSGLDVAGVRNFCSRVGNVTLTPRAAARLRDHTGGVPLHLRALVEEVPAAALCDPGLPLPAPRSFAMLVIRRLAACPATTRRFVVAAAFLDNSCPAVLAAQLSGLDNPLDALDGAIAAGLLQEPRPGTVAFPHPLIRAAIYHDLGVGLRTQMHSRAADLIKDQHAALHHRVAACGGGDAVMAAEVAGLAQRQAAVGNWRAAADHWRTAARLHLDRAGKDRCMLESADCLLQSGEIAEASALRRELDDCTDGPWRQYLLGHLSAGAGQLHAGARFLQTAWATCDRDHQPALAARIAAVMARVASLVTPGDQAVGWAHRALRLDKRAGHAANALDLLLLSLGHAGRTQQGLDLARQLPVPSLDGRPGSLDGLMGSGVLRMWTDDLPGAIERLATVAEAYRRYGPADFAVTSCNALAEAQWRAGTWDDAIVNGELAVSLADATEQRWLAPLIHARAAYPYIGRGQWEQAEAHLSLCREPGGLSEPYPAAWAWEVEGLLALAQGELDKAAAALEPLRQLTGNVASRLGNQPGLLEWRDTYAEVLTALGRFDEADQVLRPLEELGELHARRSALLAAARARGTLQAARGQRAPAEAAFRAGLTYARGLQRPFSIARLELACGCFFRRTGRRAAAVEQLENAHRRLLALGARPWLEQCERELAACGRVLGPAPGVNWPGLTSQERAVSLLAAEGLTNRQIAMKLVLSVKTIEYHLGNVYAKLGVRSRTQLARRLTLD
jgi:ATP/maltotriose-dependent transcriptional regulator MalT